jgi:hypothetical protein
VSVLAHLGSCHLLQVVLERETVRLIVHVDYAVIEDSDGAVGLAPGVVLVGPPGARVHLEVALLAAQAPHDLAGFTVDLVDGRGYVSGDEQVGVVIDVYRSIELM